MRVDFADLKQRVSILQVLEFLNIRQLTEHNDTLRGKCPFCAATNPRGFVVTPAKGTWYCFSERKGGDIIRLAAQRFQCDDKEAAERIATQFTNGGSQPSRNPHGPSEGTQERKTGSGFDPLAYLQTLDAEHEALEGLDILPETLIAFKAGYCSKGLNRGRLAVAWHDLHGTVAMFIGVALKGEIPEYLIPKGQDAPYWFNIHQLEPEQELRILPGVLDVLRATENGCTNIICPLRQVDALSLSALSCVVKEKKLSLEF